MITQYTIANGIDDICTDILYDSATQADAEAKENGVTAYRFDWDGVDAQSMINIEEI